MEKDDANRKRQRLEDRDDIPTDNRVENQQGKELVEKDSKNEEEEPIELFEFSREQKEHMIDEARCDGFWAWIHQYAPTFGLASLFRVFDYDLPQRMLRSPPEELLPLLKSLFVQKASKRSRLEYLYGVDHVVELIEKSKNILILTGAGVSVSCGIPDFRSKNGIYSRLSEFELSDPQEMFDIHYFKYRPETFYSFAKEIYPSNFKPSTSHWFIKLLEEKGKLLRNYTQNIDTLENMAGISNVVQCHGLR
jgi:hypothetical protein